MPNDLCCDHTNNVGSLPKLPYLFWLITLNNKFAVDINTDTFQ